MPIRDLWFASVATVKTYTGTKCRKFASAAHGRLALLRECPRGYSPSSFSPPVRWGLLDFKWVVFSSASSFFSFLSPIAIMWAQYSLPGLNHDYVSTKFLPDLNRDRSRLCVAQCASGDAGWRGSVYWKKKNHGGKGHLCGYNQIRLHLAYGYAYAKNHLQFCFFAANFYYLQMFGILYF